MDKKLKLIFLSLVLVLLFMPMASALFGRCRSDPDCTKKGYVCIKDPGKEVGKCRLEAAIRRAGFMKPGEVEPEVSPVWEDVKYFFGGIAGGVGSFFGFMFGHPAGEAEIRWLLTYFVVFFILAFGLTDIFTMFGVFPANSVTPKVFGIGLAAIAALSGVIGKLVAFAFGAVALYGALAVTIGMVFAITCWIVLHFTLFSKMGTYIQGRIQGKQIAEMGLEIENTVNAGLSNLKAVSTGAKKAFEKTGEGLGVITRWLIILVAILGLIFLIFFLIKRIGG